jgi:hypothetical protein
MKKPTKQVDYINNQKFYEEIKSYQDRVAAYERMKEHNSENLKFDLTRPPIPEYIGECILMIATKLSNSRNFKSYTYKDEMILDSIENCFQYFHNFDPEKTKNPFAYFTQIIWFAFIRRIQKEKKQQYIKAKNLQTLVINDSLMNNEISVDQIMPNDALNDLIKSFETPVKPKKPNTPKGVDKLTSIEK